MATNNKVDNTLGTTAYAVICGGTTALGAVQPVASLGNAGDVLTSNGAGALPSFQPIPGAGALVQIGSTQTASNSANINFTSAISATYSTYLVVISNAVPVSAGALQMLFSVNNGSSYLTTGYQAGNIVNLYNSNSPANGTNTAAVDLSGGQATTATLGVCGLVWLYNINTANNPEILALTQWNNGSAVFNRSIGNNSTTTGVNALRFQYSASNISSGSFTLFGVTK